MTTQWSADSTQIDASGAVVGGLGQWTADGWLPAQAPTGGSFDYTTLITSEHNQQPNFVALVGALANSIGAIRDVAASLPAAFDLDLAFGIQLDILGLWIGQPRLVPNVITPGFFGFQDTYGAAGFGELTNPSIGGQFWDLGTPFSGSVQLNDAQYRTVLRAKIISNQFNGTAAELVLAIDDVFQATASIQDAGNLAINLTVSTPVSPLYQALITQFDLLPRTAGVPIGSINYIQVPLQGAAVSTSTASATPTGPW